MSVEHLIHTTAFTDSYQEVGSAADRAAIRRTIEALATFPDMGATRPRQPLIDRYGTGIRTMPSGRYVIVYERDRQELRLLALVPGRLIV